MSQRLLVLCVLASLSGCHARTLLDGRPLSPVGAPLLLPAELWVNPAGVPAEAPSFYEIAPHAGPAAAPLEPLSGSMSAAVLDSIMSFKARSSSQASPCEQLTQGAALASSGASSPGSALRLRGIPADQPPEAFFFRDPRIAFLAPQQQQQGQQQGLVQPAPAEAEGTGVLPLTGAGPSPSIDGSNGQTALPCTALPVNIFAALAKDGYII